MVKEELGTSSSPNAAGRMCLYLEVFVFDARLVALEPLDGDPLLAPIQKLCRDGRVGHEDANDNPPGAAQAADDDKLVPPRRQRAADVADGVAQEAAQRDARPVGRVPEADAQRLFLAGVPLERNVSQAWVCGWRKRARYRRREDERRKSSGSPSA